MRQPPGFESPDTQLVCKLNKSLYGLKQSPRAWFDKFSKVVKMLGYRQGQADHTLFVKHSNHGHITILIVYVDDIIVTGDDSHEMTNIKLMLAKEFEVKDLGPLRYFLGMEIARNRKGISVSQRKYTLDLLAETGMLGCKPSRTPLELGNKQALLEGKPVDVGSYQRLVGKLIYLSHTRPDIAFAVSLVSQYMHSPCQGHLDAVYRILRYLKLTPGRGLFFAKTDDRSVSAFTDADWAGSISDRRSTSGYCTMVWGNLVTWRSKKQSVVARSSAEAEYRAMAHGLCELIWIRRVLQELKMDVPHPMQLFCDNKSTISIAHNPVHHDRTKHVEVDRHFIKEKLDAGLIIIHYIPTSNQLADILTKGLPEPSHEVLVGKLGLINIYDPA
ncbi:Cysteine-rich RLK (receptor-like protein kinase) 8 [Dorcoceras hygrometricum]|uniref:Cysteine-rich RLK (Receptor-like protein kinase) 8 n=1 Tax=Dorcoceras hygrometricum TaxID=472368 RepID=A0A2Z7AKI2_9LAMI|nr:Cysteine-rich RLK (receptor-like protein kinase) 8 [Dorcoceras hygrometricum]